MSRRSRSAAPTTSDPPQEYEEGRHLPISVGQTCDPLPPFVPHAPVYWRGKDPSEKGCSRAEKIAAILVVVGLIIRFRDYFYPISFSLSNVGTSLAVVGGIVILSRSSLLKKAQKDPLGGDSKSFVDAKNVFSFELLNGNFDRDDHTLSTLIRESQTEVADMRSMEYPKEIIDFGALALLQAVAAAAEGPVPAPTATAAVAVAASEGESEDESGSGDDDDDEEGPSRTRRTTSRAKAKKPAPSTRRSASKARKPSSQPAASSSKAEKKSAGIPSTASDGAPVLTEANVLTEIGQALAQAIRASQSPFAVPTAIGPGHETLPSGRTVPALGMVRPDLTSAKGFGAQAYTTTKEEARRRTKGPWSVAKDEINKHLAEMYKLQLGTLPIDCHPVQLARLWDVALRPPRVLVFEWKGDMFASGCDFVAKFIDFAIKTCVPGRDEVLLVLESGGGGVAHYGRAAAEFARLRAHGVKLTICVDYVAASGGYMVACVADRIVAAPFSFVGSIGVIAQIPNIHKVLKKHDVDMYQVTAGRFKRTVTTLGPVTREDEKKLQGELEVIHRAFTDHIGLYRPSLAPSLADIATGEVWLGRDALRLGLVDAIGVSSEVIQQATRGALVIKVTKAVPQSQRILSALFGDSSDADSSSSVGRTGGLLGRAASTVADAIAPHLTAAVVSAMGAGVSGGVASGAMGATVGTGAGAAGGSMNMRAEVRMPQGSVANLAQFA